MGVDTFAVIDNGSTDGTREIVDGLRNSYDLHLFDDRGPFDQERLSMMLARHLRDRQRADWIISNDADEFWVPKSGSLKHLLDPSTPVLRANRYNFLPRVLDLAATNYKFYHNVMLIEKPYGRQPPAADPDEPLLFPIMFRTMPGKTVCTLAGLEHIHQGNHAVRHTMGEARHTDAVVVLHYQIRTYQSFESKIRNHGPRLQLVSGPTSWHLRRWHAAYRNGALKDEYDSLLLSDAQTQALLTAGVIREEHVIADFFAAPGEGA